MAGGINAGMADGTASHALFNSPGGALTSDIATDSSGNVYVVDRLNYRVRMITPTGIVTTVAGQGSASLHDDGIGTLSAIANVGSYYSSITVDASGNIYVGESTYVRKIAAATRIVTTLAGNGALGYADGFGSAAIFNWVGGIVVSTRGMIYAVDSANYVIRQITQSGTVTVLAGKPGVYNTMDGSGTNAQFYTPTAAVIDSDGNIFVGDYNNLRKVTSAGVVTTVAGMGHGATGCGNNDGVGTIAQFSRIYGIALSTSGTLFVSDNNVIRRVTSAGSVTTVIGSGVTAVHEGSFTAASFYNVRGIAIDANGTIFSLSNNDNAVRSARVAGKEMPFESLAFAMFDSCHSKVLLLLYLTLSSCYFAVVLFYSFFHNLFCSTHEKKLYLYPCCCCCFSLTSLLRPRYFRSVLHCAYLLLGPYRLENTC